MLYPIIPESSLKVLSFLGLNENDLKFESIENHEILKIKNKINKINILFKKIEKND